MNFRDLPLNPTPLVLRQFAAAWILFFGVIAAVQYLVHDRTVVAATLATVAITIGPMGLIRPMWLRPIFVVWMIAVFPIGWVVSRITLLVLFFGIFTPLAIYFRVTGRDLLRLRKPADATSYWQTKPAARGPRSYFQQF